MCLLFRHVDAAQRRHRRQYLWFQFWLRSQHGTLVFVVDCNTDDAANRQNAASNQLNIVLVRNKKPAQHHPSAQISQLNIVLVRK